MNQQEQLEALAEQNRLLREALLKLACLGHGDSYGNSICNCIAQDALALPDLSTSTLNQRDVKTLGEAVCVCEELLLGRSTFSTDEIFGIRCCIRGIERLAAEKEKSCK